MARRTIVIAANAAGVRALIQDRCIEQIFLCRDENCV